MMTNRELLEYAAKAAGLTHLTYCEVWDCMAVYHPAGYFEWKTIWKPTRVSAHAIDLITQLQLCVQGHDTGVTVSNVNGAILIQVEYDSDSRADKSIAVLLAITKVAATIGKQLTE